MITASRNFVVVVTTFIAALLVVALGQGGLSALFPVLSGRTVGSTDIATYALLVLLAVMFLLVGFLVPRWLRSERPLVWLLLPIIALYLSAILGQPDVYRCNPLNTNYVASCWVTLSPFIVSAVAVVTGHLLRRYAAH